VVIGYNYGRGEKRSCVFKVYLCVQDVFVYQDKSKKVVMHGLKEER